MKQSLSSSEKGHRQTVLVLNLVLAVTGAAAVAALVMEYGFRTPPLPKSLLHTAQIVIVAVFVLDRLVRVALARRRLQYLRESWIDFALMGVAGLAVAVSYHLAGRVVSAGALYVAITQAYILVTLILRAVSVNLQFAGSGFHPSWLLMGSFAALILAGTGLLLLDKATPADKPGLSFIDALFTATSATCVTGLVVKDTGGDFSPFGQAVILFLIQSGGLGIMLFGTVFALLIGRELSVRSTSTLGQMLATDQAGQLKRTAAFVVAGTFGLEALGALLFYPMFAGTDPTGRSGTPMQAAWQSVFHSISSFCNAGFSLYAKNMFAGVEARWPKPLRDHWQLMGVMAPLIVMGGLGFPVLQDCARYARDRLRRTIRRLRGGGKAPGRSPALLLHSKIVLSASVSLIALGAAVMLLIEPAPKPRQVLPGVIGRHALVNRPVVVDQGDWAHMPRLRRLREAVFQSVSARTAGFNTINPAELSDAGKLSLCWLMVIGGSPASTAGGMKTVTFALLIATAYCVVRQRNELELFKRTVSAEFLRKVVTLGVLYLALVSAVTLLLSAALSPLDKGFGFVDVLFEACSACGTVGLSTGLTGHLNPWAKIVIVAGMFIGRLGPLTLVLALTSRLRHVKYAYPHENVVIG